MRWLDRRGNVGVILLVVGVVALVGGPGSRASSAADPDRYVVESDGQAEQFGRVLESGANRIDRDWPDTIRLRAGRHDVGFDTERFSRKVERIARRIERNVVRGLERESARGARRVRVRRDRDHRLDREDIETELRELQREMRRLERQLEKLGADGDI